MRIRELKERRNANSKTFLRDDGKLETDIYLEPVHYCENSRFKDIDLSLGELADGIKISAARYGLQTPLGNKLRFTFAPGVCIDYLLPVRQGKKGNKIIFTEAWPYTDVEYFPTAKGIKANIILSKFGHPDSFSFPVSTSGCSLEQEGSAFRVLDRAGEQVGTIRAPFAKDARGRKGEVAVSYAGNVITFIPDEKWLDSAAYPVTIDPTTIIQPDETASADVYIFSGEWDINQDSEDILVVGKTLSGIYRSLLKFNMSGITGTVYEATLTLYCYNHNGLYGINIHKITGSWSEGTVTWDTRPAFDSTVRGTVTVSGVGPVDFDLTSLAEEWRTGDNYGVLLKFSDTHESSVNSSERFSSSRAETPSARPKLTVVYAGSSPTVVVPASVDEESPTNYSNEISPLISWTISGYTQGARQVQFFDSDGGLVYDSGEVSGSGTTYSPPISSGLKYGEVYGVRVRAKDAADSLWSDWSILHYFICVYTAVTGFTATPDAANGKIDLAWTAHAGENLAGYDVCRRVHGTSTYYKLNATTITTNSYSDEIPGSGVTYDYVVYARAIDGYLSPASAVATSSVTVTKNMVNGTPVKVRRQPVFEYPRRVSRRVATNGEYIIQDLGLLPRVAQIALAFESLIERDALLALLPANGIVNYRDRKGNAIRGKVTGTVAEERIEAPYKYWGTLTFEISEVK